jgi:hypothetical protein
MPLIQFNRTESFELQNEYAVIKVRVWQYSDSELPIDTLVQTFIRSHHFRTGGVGSFGVCQISDERTLGPFNLLNINAADFLKVDKAGVEKFLIDYFNDSNGGDERESFKEEMSKFPTLGEKFIANNSFILDRDWFDSTSNKLTDVIDIYVFFLIIIGVKPMENKIIVSEWFYD